MKRLVALVLVVTALAITTGEVRGAPANGTASFSFKDTRAQDALRLIAAQFGYSFVMGAPVTGTFAASLTDLTFEQSVAYVAEATGCEYRIDGKVLIVNPAAMRSKVFHLLYLDPGAAADAVLKVVSEKGTVRPFSGGAAGLYGAPKDATSRENALIVTDTPARLDAVERVLQAIDMKPRLIAIEAKLVETTLGHDERMGLDWQVRASAKGAVIPHTFPFPKSSGVGDFTAEPNPNNQIGGGGPAFPPGQAFPYASPSDFTFGKLSFSEFGVILELLKEQSSTNLVSAPKVTTLDNQQAEIVVGTVVPIARYERLKDTGTLEITGYDEKKVGVRLLVTPRMGADSTMVLTVSPEISEILEYRGQFNERPVTSTRSASTQVVMRSGETVMIGGLIKEVESKVTRKVPFLGDIPLLGALFTHKTTSKHKVDLMIFITPHLIGL